VARQARRLRSTGSNFPTILTQITITLNGATGPVVSATNNQIVFTLPFTSNFTGPFTVTTPGGTVTSTATFRNQPLVCGHVGLGALLVATGDCRKPCSHRRVARPWSARVPVTRITSMASRGRVRSSSPLEARAGCSVIGRHDVDHWYVAHYE